MSKPFAEQLADLRAAVDALVANLTEHAWDLIKWLFVAWVLVVGLIALLWALKVLPR